MTLPPHPAAGWPSRLTGPQAGPPASPGRRLALPPQRAAGWPPGPTALRLQEQHFGTFWLTVPASCPQCHEHRTGPGPPRREEGPWRPAAHLTHVFAEGLAVGRAKDFKLDVGVRAILPKLHHPCEAGDVTLQREGQTIGELGRHGQGGEGRRPQGKRDKSGHREASQQGLGARLQSWASQRPALPRPWLMGNPSRLHPSLMQSGGL